MTVNWENPQKKSEQDNASQKVRVTVATAHETEAQGLDAGEGGIYICYASNFTFK